MPSRPAKKTKRPATPPNPDAFFTQAEVDAVRHRTEGAGSARNPEAVLSAFVEGGEPFTVAGHTIPVIGLGRYILIERIKSPVLEEGGWERLNNDQLSELIFVCIQPESRTRELLAQDKIAAAEGRAATSFADAVAAFADGIALASISAIGAAIALRLRDAFSTIISPATDSAKKKATEAPGSPSATTA